MKKLRKQRQMLGWSQHDMARAAAIRPGRVEFWETGRIKLSDVELERIKAALARRAKEVTAALASA
jgi:transcriptional regulator with XRE-family HTH domain